jgi:hypothetical protein
MKMTTSTSTHSNMTCGKCNGSGHLPHYNHIQAGRCFRCGGSGKAAPRHRRPIHFNIEFGSVEYGDGSGIAFGALREKSREDQLSFLKNDLEAYLTGSNDYRLFVLAVRCVALSEARVTARLAARLRVEDLEAFDDLMETVRKVLPS